MKITDFEIGKKYTRNGWYNQVLYVMCPREFPYKLKAYQSDNDEEWFNYAPDIKDLQGDDWVEIEEEREEKQDFIFSGKELLASLEIARLQDEIEILRNSTSEINKIKNQICELKNQLYESRSKENELSNLICKFQKEAEETKAQLKEAITLLKDSAYQMVRYYSSNHYYEPLFQIAIKIKDFLNKNKD